MTDDKLYSTKEAATFLNVSTRTIERWRQTGKLIPYVIQNNGYSLYSRSQLEKMNDVEGLIHNVGGLREISQAKVNDVEGLIHNVGGLKTDVTSVTTAAPEKSTINIIITPTNTRKEANDKLTEKLFSLPAEVHEALVTTDANFNLIEVDNQKHGKVLSPFWLDLIDEYTDTTPLTQLDRFVLAACISEWVVGNRYTTPNIIFRHITGQTGSKVIPTPEQLDEILASIRKLMKTQIRIDMSEACIKLGYNHGHPLKITSTLLPSAYVESIMINGTPSNVLFMDRESPILTVAIAKNQILTYDEKLLDVPKQHNSDDAIAVKNYFLHRVEEIKLHSKNMEPVITFSDVFEKCRLVNADRMKKMRLRQTLIELAEHLQTSGEIKSYSVNKQGKKYISISFTY